MNHFTYYTPTKVVFGSETELQTRKLVKECGGTRVLIHYGGGSAVRSGLLSRVCASLDKEGIFHTELGGVVPNPRISKVREGIAIGLEQKL
ncbi:MAG: iron-containing alcohol dehydrogenase, partial [Stomatobaculum sp.]|nr:iron-containing alcohol dehydrogenase [Stomatobaculum sp.]